MVLGNSGNFWIIFLLRVLTYPPSSWEEPYCSKLLGRVFRNCLFFPHKLFHNHQQCFLIDCRQSLAVQKNCHIHRLTPYFNYISSLIGPLYTVKVSVPKSSTKPKMRAVNYFQIISLKFGAERSYLSLFFVSNVKIPHTILWNHPTNYTNPGTVRAVNFQHIVCQGLNRIQTQNVVTPPDECEGRKALKGPF